MTPRRRWLAAAGAVLAAGLLLSLLGGGPVAVAKRVVGYPAWRQRASAGRAEPFFDRLAASQIGYAPAMPKAFTSPRSFTGFRVVRQQDGRTVYRGGAGRRVPTTVLGDLEEAWVGDFTSVSDPGRYRVETDDGLESFPFDVGPGVLDGPIRAAQRALYYQRAFTAIDARHAEGPWTHTSDAHLAPPGVVKGWHDAGDLSIYSASAASTLFWLLETASDFAPTADDTNIPESGNGVPDLLDEARWGLEWVLSVQEASGGFRNTTCQEAYGPYGTNRPEAMPPYRPGEVGTLATARAVGTLAYASVVFQSHDRAFAGRCLEAAWRGQRFLEARPDEASDGPTCPNFRQDRDARAGRETRQYAAAGMLLATGDERFRRAYEASASAPGDEEPTGDPSAYRPHVYAALLYLRAPAGGPARKATIRGWLGRRAAQIRADGEAHPFRWSSRYLWGSIAIGFHRTAAFSVKPCLADPEANAADCRQALDNLHYALGRNALQRCHLSGLEGASRSRQHAFHQWLAALGATPFLFPGLVAGGPVEAPEATDTSYPHARPRSVWGYWGDPAMPRGPTTPIEGRYTDNDSWSTNELDVDWQAVTLYHLHFASWWARRQGPADRHATPPAAPAAAVLEPAGPGHP